MQAGVQQQAANQDFAMKSMQWRQNVTDAWASARDQQGQLLMRELQDQNATTTKIHLQQIDAAQKTSLVRVSAAYGGVSGISVDNIANDVIRRSDMNIQTDRENFLYSTQQLETQKRATVTQAQGRIDSLAIPQPPNPASFGVNVLASGVRMFGQLSGVGMGIN